MINENDDKRASFKKVLGTSPFVSPNYVDWIDENAERL